MTQYFVKNYDELIFDDLQENQKILRKIGLKALEKAISSVKPNILVEKSVRITNSNLHIKDDIYNLDLYKKIYIIGGGKATADMATALEKILIQIPDLDYEGIINIPYSLKDNNEHHRGKIKFNFTSHPTPDESGLYGTKSMIELIEKASKDTLIIILISGGGSSLLPSPKKGISINDLQRVNSLLLASGANIHEINTIRKHISDFKGGNLAKKIWKSNQLTSITLIISDVIGNDLDSIASGPTVPDSTTYQDAYEILIKYSLIDKVPQSIINIIEEGLHNPPLENPKKNDICFNDMHNYLIGSVESAVQAVTNYLSNQEFLVEYFSNQIKGEAKHYGKKLYEIVLKKTYETYRSSKRLALVGTGELTVTIKGNGIGGRNQEMLLSFLDSIKVKSPNHKFLIIAVNLDGIEGNSKAMGGLIDNYSLKQIKSKKLNIAHVLNNNNSNYVFKILKSEIITGPTGCNVNDLVLILIFRGNDEK